jgi:hypothetical protein
MKYQSESVYQSPTDAHVWHGHNVKDGGIPQTWTDVLFDLPALHAAANDLRPTWVRLSGGEKALDELIFFHIMTRMNEEGDGPNDPYSMSWKNLVTRYPTVFEQDFTVVYKGILRKIASLNRAYSFKPDDVALLILMGLCYPKSIAGLAGWLRADIGVSSVQVIELLQRGVGASAIGEMLSGGLDISIIESLVSGRNAIEVNTHE